MNTIIASPQAIIPLGLLGENEHTVVRFPVARWLEEYPGCSFTLLNRLPGEDDPYPVADTALDGSDFVWTVGSSALSKPGKGRCQLVISVNNVVAKSIMYSTSVRRALDDGGEPPDEWESWQTVFVGLKTAAETAAAEAVAKADEIEDVVAAEYRAAGRYAVGDYCMHEGKLYRCITPITLNQNWNSANWVEVKAGAELGALKNALNTSTACLLNYGENMHSGIISNGAWAYVGDSYDYRHAIIPVNGGEYLSITNPSGIAAQIAALTAYSAPQDEEIPSFSSETGWTSIRTIGSTSVVQDYVSKVPSDARYLYVALGSAPTFMRRPTKCVVGEYDYAADLPKNFGEFGSRMSAVPRMDSEDQRVYAIESGTDYDDLTSPGNYKVTASASVATMLHCPTTYTHRLLVLTTTASAGVTQIVCDNYGSSKIYVRHTNGTTWSSWVTLATTADVEAVDSKLTGVIDPDYYTGTDSEKLAAAMADAGTSDNSVILLRRMYELSENLLISHLAESNALLTFVGVGNECGFEMHNYGIHGYDSTTSYGMVSFENIQFTGTNVIFSAAHLIRVFFHNCVFNGGNYVVHSNRFTQTFYFNGCVIRNINKSIIYGANDSTQLFDVQFCQCLIERCKNMIDAYQIHGVFVSQCCIEGFFGTPFVVRLDMRGFMVTECYFEQNNDGQYLPEGETNGYGLTFDFSRTQGNIQGCVIANNRFVPRRGDTLILLRSTNYANRKGTISIRSNWIGPATFGDETLPEGCKFIKVPSEATQILDSIILDGNAGAVYDDPNHLLIDRTYATIAHTHTLDASDDMDDITEPGYYHWDGTGTAPTNAPSASEFYVQHIRSNNGFAQLAITAEGVKSRIGTGSWI